MKRNIERGILDGGLMGLLSLLLLGAGGCVTAGPRYAAAYDDLSVSYLESAGSDAMVSEDGTQLAETGNVEQTTNATDRLIIYDATLRAVVPDVDSALIAIKTMATNMGGYMQSLSDNAIVLRVPCTHLNAAIRQVEDMGEISSRRITGKDVTEEMLDLDIRLSNLTEMRDRLLKLLDRADAVEDLLAVEKELQRVTEELELLKGRIKYLSHAVRYSTLTVQLNSPTPQTELQDVIPFTWVRRLGSDIRLQPNANYMPEKRFRTWMKMDLPPDSVKLSETKGYTRIMCKDSVMLLLRREKNFKGASLAFWEPLVRQSLAGGRAIALGATQAITLNSGARGLHVAGTRALGRKTYRYLLWLIATDDHIYTFECWGQADAVAEMDEQLRNTVQSMKIKP